MRISPEKNDYGHTKTLLNEWKDRIQGCEGGGYVSSQSTEAWIPSCDAKDEAILVSLRELAWGRVHRLLHSPPLRASLISLHPRKVE